MLKPVSVFYQIAVAMSTDVIKHISYENNYLLICFCSSHSFYKC